jgi:hypothetical protein
MLRVNVAVRLVEVLLVVVADEDTDVLLVVVTEETVVLLVVTASEDEEVVEVATDNEDVELVVVATDEDVDALLVVVTAEAVEVLLVVVTDEDEDEVLEVDCSVKILMLFISQYTSVKALGLAATYALQELKGLAPLTTGQISVGYALPAQSPQKVVSKTSLCSLKRSSMLHSAPSKKAA